MAVDNSFVRKAEILCRFGCGIKLNMHASKPFVYRHFRDAVQVWATFYEFFSEIFLGVLYKYQFFVVSLHRI